MNLWSKNQYRLSHVKALCVCSLELDSRISRRRDSRKAKSKKKKKETKTNKMWRIMKTIQVCVINLLVRDSNDNSNAQILNKKNWLFADNIVTNNYYQIRRLYMKSIFLSSPSLSLPLSLRSIVWWAAIQAITNIKLNEKKKDLNPLAFAQWSAGKAIKHVPVSLFVATIFLPQFVAGVVVVVVDFCFYFSSKTRSKELKTQNSIRKKQKICGRTNKKKKFEFFFVVKWAASVFIIHVRHINGNSIV